MSEELPLPTASHLPEAEPPAGPQAPTFSGSGPAATQAFPPLTFPPVARGTPAEEDALHARCHTLNLALLGDSTERYLGVVRKLAAVHNFLDENKPKCDAADAECEALRFSCEEAEMKATMDATESLKAIEAELIARAARVNVVQEKGWCVVESPTGEVSIIFDNRYQEMVSELRGKAPALPFVGKRLSDTNRPLVELRTLPPYLRKPKHDAHGLRVDWTWFIARTDAGHGLLVFGKDKLQAVHDIMQSKEVEIFTSCNRGMGVICYGTFSTGNVSFAFKDVVTGYLPELIDKEDFGHNDDPLTELLAQWRDRENDLRFIVLTYKGFNSAFFNQVDAFFSPPAADKCPRAGLSKK